jgi:hypothetical protein
MGAQLPGSVGGAPTNLPASEKNQKGSRRRAFLGQVGGVAAATIA